METLICKKYSEVLLPSHESYDWRRVNSNPLPVFCKQSDAFSISFIDCSMEVIASNAGLLTNAEVLDIMRENRLKRSTLSGVKVELQGRELVETKVLPVSQCPYFSVLNSFLFIAGNQVYYGESYWQRNRRGCRAMSEGNQAIKFGLD